MSNSRAFFKPLFLIFDVPNLCSSGACLISSSTSFFPNSKFSALAPAPIPFFKRLVGASALAPSFTMLPKRLPSCCVLRYFCLLSPICHIRVIVTLLGKTFLLTLSYLARKDFLFSNVTRRGVMRHLNSIFLCRYIEGDAVFFDQIFFFTTGPARAPNAGPANDPNIAPTGKNPPFCLRFLRLPPMYQTPFLTDCFLILKNHRLAATCYKFCDIMSGLVLTRHTKIHRRHEPRSSASAFCLLEL